MYIPDIKVNLFSVKSMLNKGFKMSAEGKYCDLYDKEGSIVAVRKREKHSLSKMMFKVDVYSYSECVNVSEISTLNSSHRKLCQQSLGHVTNELIDSSEKRASSIGEMVHSDLYGPMEHAIYMLLFKDDFSRYR